MLETNGNGRKRFGHGKVASRPQHYLAVLDRVVLMPHQPCQLVALIVAAGLSIPAVGQQNIAADSEIVGHKPLNLSQPRESCRNEDEACNIAKKDEKQTDKAIVRPDYQPYGTGFEARRREFGTFGGASVGGFGGGGFGGGGGRRGR